MKRLLSLLLVFALVIFGLVGCAQSDGGKSTQSDVDSSDKVSVDASPKDVVTIKVGHVCAPAHPCHQSFLDFGERVEERSGGTMKVEVYPSSQLGSEREMIEMTLAGSMEIFYSGSQTLGLFCDAVNFQGLPFFFTGGKPAAREFFALYGDEIAQIFEDELDVQIVWTDNSAYGQASQGKKIVLPEDIVGVKIRTLETEMMIKTYEVLGALATPVNASEVYTALQQGTIDAATSNAILLDMMNWKEVSDYYLDSKLFVDMGVSMYTNEFFNSLTPEQQVIFTEELETFTKEYSAAFDAAELNIIDNLVASGIEVTVPNKEQYEQWIEAVQPVYTWFKEKYGEKYPELDKYIKAAQEINAKYTTE
ncbi:MAG: TRAP transporter substrate-binding protein [Tissierellia bacterium]|mgnify:CR=1 FL=1|nr:TRAP transporter substrate-binding protein [Tissierellia bacterium]